MNQLCTRYLGTNFKISKKFLSFYKCVNIFLLALVSWDCKRDCSKTNKNIVFCVAHAVGFMSVFGMGQLGMGKLDPLLKQILGSYHFSLRNVYIDVLMDVLHTQWMYIINISCQK